MKKFSLAAMAFFMLMIVPGPGFSIQQHELVERMGKGSVNWTQGTIQAKGIGTPPEQYFGKPQARPMALRAAQLDAMRNLLEVVQGVRINSSTVVRNSMVQDDEIRSNVEGMVKGAQIVKEEYLADGTFEIIMQMSLNGGFAQLVMPPEIMQVAPVKPVPPQPASHVFTGMVVDARGLRAQPAMAPKILDENGREVYGSATVSREFAVQEGMSGYATDLTSALSNPRVSNNPLTVRGLRAVGPGRSDIVISASDASQLRSASENLSFLKQCRVMIVVD